MTTKADPPGDAPQTEEVPSAGQDLRLYSSAVENYHTAGELHAYASQLTDAYNQDRVLLAQHEDKIRRMQSSFSWRCTAWLRALRRKLWAPSRPPEAAPAEPTGLIGYPFAASDFIRPSSPALAVEITSGTDLIVTGKDFTLAGWLSCPEPGKIRARIGSRTYSAKTTQVDGSTSRIAFEFLLRVENDDPRIDLELGAEGAGWHLFHRIPLRFRGEGIFAENRPSMEASLARYPQWVALFDTLTKEQLNNLRHRANKLPLQPLLSLAMPVYNTDARWLRRAIESIQAQIYTNWELCIADDASTAPHVRPLLEQFAAQDPRVKVNFRSVNGHISAASNSALELASGEFTAFVDHDDELPPHALFYFAELINLHPDAALLYSDEDKITETGTRFHPHFKPDWNPDLLNSQNYLCHLVAYRTTTLKAAGGFRTEVEGAQDWDLALRVTEKLKPAQIHHIPRILYNWRATEGSTALQLRAKDYTTRAAQKALADHFTRTNQSAIPTLIRGQHWHIRHAIPTPAPLVTLIIPTRNRRELLVTCVESILAKTTYPHFEILIADNDSDDPELLAYYEKQKTCGRFTVLPCPGPFNFSAINNRAVKSAGGKLIGLLNNDLEVISPDWLDEMASHALRPEIGVVGARLLYPDLRVQHAGIVVGLGGVAGHAFKKFGRHDPGTPQFRLHVAHNISAVTAACALVRKDVFEQVGGFDETNLTVAFNDVDLCLRVEALGYRNLYTPFAELIHHESASRGSEYAPGKLPRFTKEIETMKHRWGQRLQDDPAYNPNLTVDTEDFALAFPPRHAKPS